MFLQETKRKYGVHTVICEVSAMNFPFFDKRATVSVDFFGIHSLNCGIEATVVVFFSPSPELIVKVFDLSVDVFGFN